ncbi:hypothetical protein SAMN05444392_11673 [Seinonella peptonophila]|uniref:Uncharacterized protein n=1 Tax=Seinonella peptonophila TaxID=112248 RepID=A0A1M5AYB4_9BACL|nr:hypothetical protein SAMN05444392_11673 [Seinonella peptonophila]
MAIWPFKRIIGFVRRGFRQYRFYVQRQDNDRVYLWTPETMLRVKRKCSLPTIVSTTKDKEKYPHKSLPQMEEKGDEVNSCSNQQTK